MLAFGFAESELSKWRPAMFIPAAIMLIVSYLYWKFTKDTPKGNFDEAPEERSVKKEGESGLFMSAVKDKRVWILFAIYGACFGLELFVNGRAATYYQTKFMLNETTAGMIAALFGLMNLFARSTGGYIGDKFSKTGGLAGRVKWLVIVLLAEGAALILFSRMDLLGPAITTMIIFSLFVQMAEGATYSVVPFINKRSLGAVAGIVGAGGNVGAVIYAQFLLRSGSSLQDSFMYFGLAVIAISLLGFSIKFSKEDEEAAVTEQKKLEEFEKQLKLKKAA
jgi:NNP family nitrate/nitrite transporter-like MFS transporter